MKITEVRTYSPVYPVKDPFSNAMRTTRERAFGIVEVITDSGVIGWGEGATVPARRALDAQVVGRNPFDYEVQPDWPRAHEPFPTLLEYDMSENALRTELAREPIRHSGGIVSVPQGPGLGIEIDREVLQKYC